MDKNNLIKRLEGLSDDSEKQKIEQELTVLLAKTHSHQDNSPVQASFQSSGSKDSNTLKAAGLSGQTGTANLRLLCSCGKLFDVVEESGNISVAEVPLEGDDESDEEYESSDKVDGSTFHRPPKDFFEH